MVVNCPNCGTGFGFDDSQVGEGLTVRCSVCKHVFKLESPSAQPPPTWQIRTTDDMSFTAPDVATLRQWIGEGRLTPGDQVSRTGRSWVRLGEMSEFADLFAGYAGVSPVIKPVAPPAPAPAPAPVPAPTPAPTPALAPDPVPRPVVMPATGPASGAHGPGRAVPPAAAPTPEVTASPTPQSQRMTLSPPRSAPTPASAPVAMAAKPSATASHDDEDGDVLEDDELDLEDEDEDDDEDEIEASLDDADDESDRWDDDRPSPVAGELEAFEAGPRKRGVGVGWIIGAGLAVAAIAVFAVPQLRDRVLGAVSPSGQATGDTGSGAGSEAGTEAVAGAVERPEIAAAEAAMAGLGTASLARAEAGLQRAIDAKEGDANTIASMKVALADLLISRALLYEIAAAIDPAQREEFRRRAAEDREDGERLIDGLQGSADVDRLAEVRALGRLASGRAEVEVMPLVPTQAAETALIVRAAVLWQDLDTPVPDALVAGLMELPSRSGLGESALALALLRAGDQTGARNAAERLLVAVGEGDQQIVADVIRQLLPGPVQPEAGGEAPAQDSAGAAEGSEGGEANVAKAPPTPGEDGANAAANNNNGGGGGGGGGGGNSLDKLIERGCDQVAKGENDAAIKTLLRAFEKSSNNVDVLVCLADAYAGQGGLHHARQFYDRALQQAPNHRGALRGAAKVAAKTGAKQKAIELYERLLAVDPNNATALAYIANNKPGADKPGADKPDADKPEAPQPPADGG